MNTQQLEPTVEKKKPGRPRKEQMPERRRKREDSGEVFGRRLAVNASQLDKSMYEYRWINDDMARIYSKTKEDDWDIVTNEGGIVKEDSSDLGSAVSEVVGTRPDGSPKRAYLCRKPISYFEEDQRVKQQALDEQLAQLRLGNDRGGGASSDYVPHSGISL